MWRWIRRWRPGIAAAGFAAVGLTVFALSRYGLYLDLGGVNSARVVGIFRMGTVLILGTWGLISLAHMQMEKCLRFLLIGSGAVLFGLVMLFLLFIQAFGDSEPRYFRFASPDGAHTVIVEEESWLLGGWGTFYEPACPGLMRLIGEYSTDDGFRPFTAGAYELEWGVNSVTVRYDFGAGGTEWFVEELELS